MSFETLHFANLPIPEDVPSVDGWKTVSLQDNGELLVPIGPFSSFDQIHTHSIYYGEKDDSPYPYSTLPGSLITMFTRREAAYKLLTAQSFLPKGMHLVVFDAYRSIELQKSLYDFYYGKLEITRKDLNPEQLSTETQKYVSLPSTDPTKPSPHNTGGAIDLAIFRLPAEIETEVGELNQKIAALGIYNWQESFTLQMRRNFLIDKNMQLLNFGTPFDHGGEKAALRYFERLSRIRHLNEQELEALQSRRVLYHIMAQAGFQAYPDEWWHFNAPETQMGVQAIIVKTLAEIRASYGAAILSPDNLNHELMRKMHWLGSLRVYSGNIHSKLGFISANEPTSIITPPALNIVRQTIRQIGDIRETSSPLAEIIQP